MSKPLTNEPPLTSTVEPPKDEQEQKPAEAPRPAVVQEITAAHIGNQVNTPSVNHQHNYFNPNGTKVETPLEELADVLPELPQGLHPFRDPRHEQLLHDLDMRRILLLTSFGESASYAAAHTLISDARFKCLQKKILVPSRQRDKDRTDLEVGTLAQDAFLGKEPQILLVEIGSRCNLLDSLLAREWGVVGTVCDRLKGRGSYLILSVDESLVDTEVASERARDSFSYYAISHLGYLLSPYFTDRAELEELERQLITRTGRPMTPAEREVVYSRIRKLADSTTSAEEFRAALKTALSDPVDHAESHQVEPRKMFPEASAIHRAAAFVATYFTNLPQCDFDRLVALLVGEETKNVEHTRQVISRYGIVGTVREEKRERWAEIWQRDADSVFRDCHLQAVTTASGSWIVDFSDPSLRPDLRAYIERHHPWFLRSQCGLLQKSGILFALNLSPAAIDGLVRLFVERAVADPADFGVAWLLDLIRTSRLLLKGRDDPADDPLDDFLMRLLEEGSPLRWHFHSRLAILIREMLDRDVLRPVVQDFFDCLITGNRRVIHVHIALDLVSRLRAAPYFDAMKWMRRIFNEGGAGARERAEHRLISLARECGPRIYEFLSVIHDWLPDEETLPERFSPSEHVALAFPFLFCEDVARRISPERYGEWPTRHPLFYALPDDAEKARQAIAGLMEWILDPRGAALETETTDALRTPEAVRISFVADLVEHWAWVLEGPAVEAASPGSAIFQMVIEEIDRRIAGRERSWFQRIWQRRQDELLGSAATAEKSERRLLIARKTKLDQLRKRFAALGMAAVNAN